MRNELIFVFILLIFSSCGQQEEFVAERTTAQNRAKFRENTVQQTIESALQKNLSESSESEWQGAFWAMGLMRYRSVNTDCALQHAFEQFFDRSLVFQRALLETAYGLYPAEFTENVLDIVRQTKDPKIFAMAAEYVYRIAPKYRHEILDLAKMRMSQFSTNPLLIMLRQRFLPQEMQMPPLADLFANPKFNGYTVYFSLQRKDRQYPGLLLIRKPDGDFYQGKRGKLFQVAQLALANSGLPGYLTNGNTPQGILSVQGSAVSENAFIGPTKNLQLCLPFECLPREFFHSEIMDTSWQLEQYQSLLPPSWQDYFPVLEAWYAGQAGRTEIIAHGSTIDPEFYRDKPYYPHTPSLGCLTTLELWSPENGKRLVSNQQKLMDAFNDISQNKGFFVIVELDDEQKAVELSDVLDFIAEAQKRNNGSN